MKPRVLVSFVMLTLLIDFVTLLDFSAFAENPDDDK